MAFDFGAAVGNLSGNPSFDTQPTRKITDQSPHVDGGKAPGSGYDTSTGRQMLMDACILLVVAVAILWFLGGVAFRGHNL